ncbi:MAG: FeoB-associated Cys-rich membrane protein [Bacteroidaceae bacterium]|nr:FeoB-associated Cys-rich membrane protein [Bacteroidaceae bacterium]
MNAISIIIVLVIAAAVVAVVSYLWRKGSGCSCNSCEGCPLPCKKK